MKDAKSKTIAGEVAAVKMAALLTAARIGYMVTPANDAGTEWGFQVLPGDARKLAKAHAAASEPDVVDSVTLTQTMTNLLPATGGKPPRNRKYVGFAKLFGAPPNAILVQLIHDDPDEKCSCIRFSWQSSLPVLDVCSTTIVFKENMESRAIAKFDAITHADAAKVVAEVETQHLEAFGNIAANPDKYDPAEDAEEDEGEGPQPKYGDQRAYQGGCGITEDG